MVKNIYLCNISSQNFYSRFSRFSFRFSFFVFFLFFLFFPFSFPFRFSFSFLLFLHAHVQATGESGAVVLSTRDSKLAREFQEWAPPLTHESRASLSHVRVTLNVQSEPACVARPRKEKQQQTRSGGRHSDQISASSSHRARVASTAQSQPFVRYTRDLKPKATRSRI